VDHQPRSGVRPKKRQRDRLIALAQAHPDWALGFADEVWWSRLAQPHLHAWAESDHPLRLVEQAVAKDDPDPQALACYGVLLRGAGQPAQDQQDAAVWLRFVGGRPVSAVTTQFLDWCCPRLETLGVLVWVLIWDNASWHVSKAVRAWIRTHNRAVKRQGQGVRILVCYLPVKSPWLNPIEPKWVHSKRAIVEPTRLLSAQEVAERVCAYHGCPHEPHLSLPDPVLDKAS
jgi:transposase